MPKVTLKTPQDHHKKRKVIIELDMKEFTTLHNFVNTIQITPDELLEEECILFTELDSEFEEMLLGDK